LVSTGSKKAKMGRPKSGKAKEAVIKVRTTRQTAAELRRIAGEMDRSVSWVVNHAVEKFIAGRGF
jgi:predicted transcriptional regulator